jgi:undecaprenyl-diphosphatase
MRLSPALEGSALMNDRIEDLINGMSGHVWLLDRVMTTAATGAVFLLGVMLVALWCWPAAPADRARRQRVAAAAVVAALLALLLGQGIGHLVPEARPFATDPDTRLLIAHAADNGLPSDHALVSFALGGTVVWWNRRLGVAALALAVAIGIARIYVGVHWPGDIAAGALVGLLVGGLAARTVPWCTAPQRWCCRWLPPWLLSRP